MRLRNIPEAKQIVAESRHVIPYPLPEGRDIRSYFEKDLPVHIEIGMGKGSFLITMAQLHPEINYLGVERYETVLMRAVQKMDALTAGTNGCSAGGVAESGRGTSETDAEGWLKSTVSGKTGFDEFPENIKFLCADAEVLPELFPEGSIDMLYLNFSDPWPKARHAKRRLTSDHFLHVYEKFMKPGAILQFKTDNAGLFDFSEETIREEKHWELLSVTRDLHHTMEPGEENVMTEYERKFSLLGNKICRLRAVYNG